MFNQRQKTAYDFFVSRGWSPVQAAAIVGGGVQESGANLNSTALGDNGSAYGGWQWRNERRAGLMDFARRQGASPADLLTQAAYVDHELRTRESASGNALRRATDPMSAAKAFIGYERPRGWTPQNPSAGDGFGNRYNNLLNVLRGAGQPSASPMMTGRPGGAAAFQQQYPVMSYAGAPVQVQHASPIVSLFASDQSSPLLDSTDDFIDFGGGGGSAGATQVSGADPAEARRQALIQSIGQLFG